MNRPTATQKNSAKTPQNVGIAVGYGSGSRVNRARVEFELWVRNVGYGSIICPMAFLYNLYFAKMAARYKKILNTKYTKKSKSYTQTIKIQC